MLKNMINLQSHHIGGQARQSHEQLLLHLKDSLKIAADSDLLHTETRIRADGDAILAGHRNDAGAVVFHN